MSRIKVLFFAVFAVFCGLFAASNVAGQGVIVPIVDLRVKFEGEAKYDEFTVVIILSVSERVLGIVVDAVSDVMTLSPEQIRPAPPLGGEADTQFITGLGTVGTRMLIVTDIERLLGARDLRFMQAH